jgi:hypothetical protein
MDYFAGAFMAVHARAGLERLRKEGCDLVYRCAKQQSEPSSDKRGTKADELHLTPLELIARIHPDKARTAVAGCA